MTPNWKYPCIACSKPVKCNQKGLECNACKKWVHFKCTDLADDQYNLLEVNEDIPFYCLICSPRPHYADVILDNINSINTVLSETSLNSSIDSAKSSDFVYADEPEDSDLESRGLNFESLPIHRANTMKKTKLTTPKFASFRTITYKYPCLVCFSPCKEKITPVGEKAHLLQSFFFLCTTMFVTKFRGILFKN